MIMVTTGNMAVMQIGDHSSVRISNCSWTNVSLVGIIVGVCPCLTRNPG